MNKEADITTQKHQVGIPFSKDDPRINREGRPKGTYSLKTKIINFLKENPEAEEKLMAELLAKEQGLLLQMIDGRPHQATDLTSGGEKILVMAPELINKNDSNS